MRETFREEGGMSRQPMSLLRRQGILSWATLFLFVVTLGGCAVAPTGSPDSSESFRIPLPPAQSKTILETIQKDNPSYTIRALLRPEGKGTNVHLTVYTRQKVHMVVNGFQEPEPHKRLYPECNHWFDLTRSFDPACGGGPYLGTANLLFGDGMALGLLFDLFQAGRYPFAYTTTPFPDREATEKVKEKLLTASR